MNEACEKKIAEIRSEAATEVHTQTHLPIDVSVHTCKHVHMLACSHVLAHVDACT